MLSLGQKKIKLRGGCRVGTTSEPLGPWCFITECRLCGGKSLFPSFSGPCAAGSLPRAGVLAPLRSAALLEPRWAPSLPPGLCWGQQLLWAALITAPLNFRPQLPGAGELVLAPGRKGCVHELMGTLQSYFSPYSLYFFCGSVCSLFHLWAKGSIWQSAVHLAATYCEIIMQANLAPSWIS